MSDEKTITKRPGRQVFNKRFDQHAPLISLGVQREICRLLATGKTVKEIVEVEGIPSRDQIYNLMWRDPVFKRMYKDARICRAEVWAEELREKAAEGKNLDDIPEKKAMAYVQAIRNIVDTDKWLLSKILREEYGDDLPVGDPRRGNAIGDVLQVIKEVQKLARAEAPIKTAKATVVPELQLHEKTTEAQS